MYQHIIGILLTSILLSPAFADTPVRCKPPSDTLPVGVQKALTATVAIHSTIALDKEHLDENTAAISSISSGFILDTQGHVVMSGHVIARYLEANYPSRHSVVLHDCRQFAATVIATGGDEHGGVDAVLLKIDTPPQDLVAIKRTSHVPEKSPVYAIGTPYGWMNTVYEGVLAGPYVNKSDEYLFAYIQLREGMSGGSLVTPDGSLIASIQGVGVVSVDGVDIPVSMFVPIERIDTFLEEQDI